jgi:Putative serine esterase (DUF676)
MKNLIIICGFLFLSNYSIGQSPCGPIITVVNPIDTLIDVLPPPHPPIELIVDCDGNGISDSEEGTGNSDGDLIFDICDPDNDGDGILDQNDLCLNVPGTTANGCPSLADETRKIFFVHGLKGSVSSWETVRAEWDIRLTKAELPPIDYSGSQNNLTTASESLENDVTEATNDPESDPTWKDKRNFIIAHSLGGIVSRHLQIAMNNDDNPVPYDGIVTFGTPHQGAKAANNKVYKPFLLNNAINDACVTLGTPLLNEYVSQNVFAELINFFVPLNQVLVNSCGKLSNFALTFLENSLSAPIEGQLTTFNASSWPIPSTKHNIAFYGQELDDNGSLTARFAGAYIKSPNHNDFGYGGADESDDEGLDAFNEHLTFFQGKADFYYDLYNNPPWYCYTPAAPFFDECDRVLNKNLYLSFNKGVQWFGRINGVYKNIIGAYEGYIGETYSCTITNNGTTTTFPISNPSQCTCGFSSPGCTAVYNVNIVNTFVEKPSDGFILVESSSIMPGATKKPELMLGSNHIQMRNDSECARLLDLLFHGDLDPYFRTE